MFHIGICDDEKSTCAELENLIYEYSKERNIEVDVTVWYTGERLCESLQNETALDLLFLDIELISTDGIQVGKYIREVLDDSDMMIAYISSKSSYAMSLFKVQPLDFLIKPLKKEEVQEVLGRSITLSEKKNRFFEYVAKGISYKVNYKDIAYFYSQNKKISVVTKKETVEFTGKLKEVAKGVPHNFLLIHQSFLVNLDYVAECSYEELRMQDGTRLSISQPYRKTVREAIMINQWERR